MGTPGQQVVSLDQLCGRLAADGIPELRLTEPAPYLRYYHTRQKDGEVYFFFNEGTLPLHTEVLGAKGGAAAVYDPFENGLTADENPFVLDLPAFGTKCVLVPDHPLPQPVTNPFKKIAERLSLEQPEICLADAGTGSTDFSAPLALNRWQAIDALPGLAAFAGRIRYRLKVALTEAQASAPARLVLEGVQEGAAVTVNGQACGTKICAPYFFPLGSALHSGENEILVEVNTTLGRRMNDFLTQYLPMEPLGVTGGAALEFGTTT